jgi:hypothetical protein
MAGDAERRASRDCCDADRFSEEREARSMADAIRLVDYFYVTLSDRPGEGARALGVLREAGVHLNAFHAFPAGRRAQLDFVPSDPSAFKAAAKMAKWKITEPKKARARAIRALDPSRGARPKCARSEKVCASPPGPSHAWPSTTSRSSSTEAVHADALNGAAWLGGSRRHREEAV